MNKLKYANYYIGYQEVPNEISLCINISGCPHKCEGCHSQYLWNYVGSFVSKDIFSLIDRYDGMITCVCFMGGDQNIEELKYLLSKIKSEYNIKTCIYSGFNDIKFFGNVIQCLDYLKIGSYKEEFGGLDRNKTNQIFFKIIDNIPVDTTNLFKKNSIEQIE